MAGIVVAGPAHVYCNGSYLGTCERSPRVQFLEATEDVMNAIAGTQLPLERLGQGRHAIIQCVFTRFNDLGAIGGQNPGGAGTAGSRFLNPPTGTGSFACRLSLQFPVSANGYNFLGACLEDRTDDELNTAAWHMGMTWHAFPLWTINAGWTLYDSNLAGLTPT